MAKKAIILVMDSFGVGQLNDADKFGDIGANTLGHIDQYAFDNKLEFHIPNLLSLGLAGAYALANNGAKLHCDTGGTKVIGSYAVATELSSGKDTTSGHWEMAGYPVTFNWGYFTSTENSFPLELLDRIVTRAKLSGYLGNCHASGTTIIQELGDEHIVTGKPIFYTSADSVFQIAAHEKHFGLERLHELCKVVREELDGYNIARVIARPFVGESSSEYVRTKNRKDYSVVPAQDTLFDVCNSHGVDVVSIGKIGDIYAHKSTGRELKASGLDELMQTTISEIQAKTNEDQFIMTNLVDFDMLYGHRRDVLGYKKAIEQFDILLGSLLAILDKDDLLLITADHGCDPTFAGSDHTREYIPILLYTISQPSINGGVRSTFADIGQTVAHYLNIPPLACGDSILS